MDRTEEPLHSLEKSDIFFSFSACKPDFWSTVRIAAVTGNRSPQIPATNSEAYAVHSQFSHVFSPQTSCAPMMLFWDKGCLCSLISRSLFVVFWLEQCCFCVSSLQSVLFQRSGSRVSCRPWHRGSVSLEPGVWQFHWDGSSQGIKQKVHLKREAFRNSY